MNRTEITAKIEETRKKMDAALAEMSIDHDELLQMSRELDQLISAYIALE